MHIHFGYELAYECPKPTPMLLALNVHYSRVSDLIVPDHVVTHPSVPIAAYRDGFGNWISRVVAPAGLLHVSTNAVLADNGLPDPQHVSLRQHNVEALPEETLVFLLGSRYCDTDLLSDVAWARFAQTAGGWPRVQAICDFVHAHVTFGYSHARATRTAAETYHERVGVCRDFTHLAIALCRCMNIPARYCTGYLSDIGEPPPYGTMDFAAWFEVFLEGNWHVFDARNNSPRIGRILIARGRDAADVAISNAFGHNTLRQFTVWTDLAPMPTAVEAGGSTPRIRSSI